MTNIYKISIKNEELNSILDGVSRDFYFETQEAAEAVMSALNAMTAKGKTLEWECTIVEALSKEDALEQFLTFAKTLP